MTPFPHHYTAELYWSGNSRGTLSAFPRADISGGAPPEFGGGPDRWSPEHLLVAAAELCLMTTFMAVAAKSKLQVTSYECRAEGTLDRTPEGPRFTGMTMYVTLGVQDEAERGLKMLELAKKNCMIANSLKCPVALEASVNGWSPAHAAV